MVDNKKNVDFSKLINEKIDDMLQLVKNLPLEDAAQVKTNDTPVKQKQEKISGAVNLKTDDMQKHQQNVSIQNKQQDAQATSKPKIIKPSTTPYSFADNTTPPPNKEAKKKSSSLKLTMSNSGDLTSKDDEKQTAVTTGKMSLDMKDMVKIKPYRKETQPEEQQKQKAESSTAVTTSTATTAAIPDAPKKDKENKEGKEGKEGKEEQQLDIHQLIHEAFSLDADEAESVDQKTMDTQTQQKATSSSKDEDILQKADALAKKAQDFRHQSTNEALKQKAMNNNDVLELKPQDVVKENVEALALSESDDAETASEQIVLSQKDLHTVVNKISQKQSRLHLLKLLAKADDNATAADIQKKLKELDEI